MESETEWLAAGRPACRLWVNGRRYDLTNARRLAHRLAEKWSDRAFPYGCDPFGQTFVDVLEKSDR